LRNLISVIEINLIDLKYLNEKFLPYGREDKSVENAFVRGTGYHYNYVENIAGFQNGIVLDLLCGFGRRAPFLASKNKYVYGIDRIPGCIKIANNIVNSFELDNLKFLCEDVKYIKKFPNSFFDSIWIWSGLQYVERGFTLSQCYRLLKPGGRLFVGAYNGPGLMLEHILNGAAANTLNVGASQWALEAVARGEFANGNPNYLSPRNAERLCALFGLKLLYTAAEDQNTFLDNSKNPVRDLCRSYGLARTIEFVAEKILYNHADLRAIQKKYISRKFNSRLQSETVTALVDPYLVNDSVVDSWMSDEDLHVQQNARIILSNRFKMIGRKRSKISIFKSLGRRNVKRLKTKIKLFKKS